MQPLQRPGPATARQKIGVRFQFQSFLTDLRDHLHSPAFADLARSPDHHNAFTRARKLPLPTLLAALLSLHGASVQSALDAFFPSLGAAGAGVLASDRALAKARAKLHVPALWALNERLLVAGGIAQGVHDRVLTLSRCWTRHIPGRYRP